MSRRTKLRGEWLAVALAFAASVSYLLIGFGVLPVGDLTAAEAPAAITYVAAAGYALGGLLILLRRRWLWVVGAVLNALIVAFFVMAYLDRPAVLFSAGGLVSKVAEVLLEVVLVYLLVTSRGRRQVERTVMLREART